jgi:hypothetical protein
MFVGPQKADGQGLPWNYSLRRLLYHWSYRSFRAGADLNRQHAIIHELRPIKRNDNWLRWLLRRPSAARLDGQTADKLVNVGCIRFAAITHDLRPAESWK